MKAEQYAKQLSDRFTDLELFAMFNVDCNPKGDSRVKYLELPYVFNDIRVPLWRTKRIVISKRFKSTRTCDDTIKEGITHHKPGSKGRVADLAKFYAQHTEAEESAFTI